MEIPKDLRYTREHEWIRIEGNKGTIGITSFAQEQLGDVVFVELPKESAELVQEKEFGVIESVKTVSDLFSPCNGKVIAANKELETKPELVNQDPYGDGWIIQVEISDVSSLTHLLSAEDYESFLKDQS